MSLLLEGVPAASPSFAKTDLEPSRPRRQADESGVTANLLLTVLAVVAVSTILRTPLSVPPTVFPTQAQFIAPNLLVTTLAPSAPSVVADGGTVGGGGLYPLGGWEERKRKKELTQRPIDWADGFTEAPTSVQLSAMDAEIQVLLLRTFEVEDAKRPVPEQAISTTDQDLFDRRKRLALILLLLSA